MLNEEWISKYWYLFLFVDSYRLNCFLRWKPDPFHQGFQWLMIKHSSNLWIVYLFTYHIVQCWTCHPPSNMVSDNSILKTSSQFTPIKHDVTNSWKGPLYSFNTFTSGLWLISRFFGVELALMYLRGWWLLLYELSMSIDVCYTCTHLLYYLHSLKV